MGEKGDVQKQCEKECPFCSKDVPSHASGELACNAHGVVGFFLVSQESERGSGRYANARRGAAAFVRQVSRACNARLAVWLAKASTKKCQKGKS